jgi:hypothetical protein
LGGSKRARCAAPAKEIKRASEELRVKRDTPGPGCCGVSLARIGKNFLGLVELKIPKSRILGVASAAAVPQKNALFMAKMW